MSKKIDKVVLTNFKKHESYIADIKGNHFIVVGPNGVGKSSIFDAIRETLGQKADVAEPITLGKDGAEISTFLMKDEEKYILEKKFSAKTGKGRLRFYRVNGSRRDELNPPLERFYEIFGQPIDFTPLIDMEGEKQFDYLKKHLGIDVSMYEHNYQAIFDDRTLLNREIKNLQFFMDSANIFAADIETYKEEKTSDSILCKRIDIKPIIDALNFSEQRAEKIATVEAKEKELSRRIEELQIELVNLRNAKENCEQWRQEHPPIDPTPFHEQMDQAKKADEEISAQLNRLSEHNQMVVKVRDYLKNKELLEQKKKMAESLSGSLRDIQTQLYENLTQLNLNEFVPGLKIVYEVSEDEKGKLKVLRAGLLLEELPFNRSQHSYGKLIKAIVKLSAYFNSGKLNFIPINDWNLLDKHSQQELLDLPRENPDLNIQFGIEKVDDTEQIITELILV